MLNTRRSRIIEFNGRSATLDEWSETIGLRKWTLFRRLERGWSLEKSLTFPKRHYAKR